MSRARGPAASLASAMAKGFLRDRVALFFAIVFPLMFLVLFGTLFSESGISRTSVIEVGDVTLLDKASGDAAAAIDDSLELSHSDDLDAALADVRSGDADAAVTQDGHVVRLWYAAADPVVAGTVQATFQAIVTSAAVAASGQEPEFALHAEQVENQDLSTIEYLTPGLLGWAIASAATFAAAITLVQWRTTGLLRKLRLAPISTAPIVTSRVGVSVVIALGQAAIFIGVAALLFGLTLAGWWWLSVPVLTAGTLAFLAIGLLAGSIAKTQEAAVAIVNIVVLPMAFLSGSFFPLDGAPEWLQTVSAVLPLKYLNTGMLDVMVRDQGPGAVVIPILVLLGFAVVVTAIATRLFRWDA